MLELAAKRIDNTFNTDTIDAPSNQRYVLSHNKFEEATREDLQSTLAKMEAEMQSLFCEASKENKSYLDFEPPRPVPTQFLAFQQLQYRFEDKSAPFLVCCVAPAGFGKSTLISGWLHWLYVNHQEKWQTMAPTGIASTQVAGATMHAVLLANFDCKYI